MPWVIIPVLWLLCSETNVTGGIAFRLPVLFVPMAIVLADRFGTAGLWTVIIGGLPLPLGITFGYFGFPPETAIYVTAIWIAALLSGDRPAADWMASLTRSWRLLAAMVLLPLNLDSPDPVLDTGATLSFDINLLPLFYAFVFVLGLSRTDSRLAMGSVLIAGIIGTVCQALPLPVPAIEWDIGQRRDDAAALGYGLDHPFEVMAALLAFLIARHIRRAWSGESGPDRDPRHGRWLLAGSMALWIAYELFLVPGEQHFAPIQQRALLGENPILPFACLLAGFRLRSSGMALAVGQWFCVLGLTNLILAGFDPTRIFLWLNVATPFAVIAFVLIGLVAGDRRRGMADMPPVGGWAIYVLLLSLTLPTFFSFTDWTALAAFCLAFALAIGAGLLGQAFWREVRRLGGCTGVRAALAMVCLALMAATILSNVQAVAGMLVTAKDVINVALVAVAAMGAWGPDDTFLVVIMLLVYLVVLLSSLSEVLAAIPAIRSDVPKFVQAVRTIGELGWAAVRVSARQASQGPTVEPPGERPITVWHRSARVVRWLRNGCFALLVVSLAVLILQLV